MAPKRNSGKGKKVTENTEAVTEVPKEIQSPKPLLNEPSVEDMTKAIEAMKKHETIQREGKPELLFEAGAKAVYMQFTLSSVPEKQRCTPLTIELPHPIYAAPAETCIIVSDPQRKWKDLLIEKPVPGIAKIIGMSKLRANYKSPQQKKELCDSFDLFLCERRINQHLPDALGGYFFKKNKMPVPLQFNMENFTQVASDALRCTYLRIGKGMTISVRVGHINMDTAQLVANAHVVFKAAFEYLTKDGSIVNNAPTRAHLLSTDLLVLPVWFNSDLYTADNASKKKSVAAVVEPAAAVVENVA